jgi:hypothetical protein
MKAQEMVTVRLSTPVPPMLINDVKNTLVKDREYSDGVNVFVDAETGYGLLIQISRLDPTRSCAGHCLASHLANIGIVNHVLWLLK